MSRSRTLLAVYLLSVSVVAPAVAQRPEVFPVPVGVVAEQLGVKLMPDAPRELELGRSATTMLAEPKKLAQVGITGMHEGARVTITCVGPNRIRVEADEMEPVAKRVTVMALVNPETNAVSPVPDKPVPKPNP
jgi:hypothetical protein